MDTNSPFAIRLELLKLAQSILVDQMSNERQRLELDWHLHNELAKEKDWTPRPFPKIKDISYNDILKVAEELNKFVSNKG